MTDTERPERRAPGRSHVPDAARGAHASPLEATAGPVVLAALRALSLLGPRPGALLIRSVFDRGSARVLAALRAHEPDDVTVRRGVRYRPGDRDALLDVYTPTGTTGPLATLVWIHGGAWISGSRGDAGPYFALLASAGYTVVSVDYTLGPRRRYPTAIRQLADALAHLLANADDLRVDPARLALAGDSAGAQLASQIAAMIADPGFASAVGVPMPVRREAVRAAVLHCGVYDVRRLASAPGVAGWGQAQALWAYLGARDVARSDAALQMCTIEHVTSAFPPALVVGGNGDPLTDTQSKPLAQRLASLGVEVRTIFWPPDHEPPLPHECQFDLDRDEGWHVLGETIAFLDTHLAPE